MMVVLLVLLVSATASWLPLEAVATTDQPKPTVMRIVDDGDGTITYMTDDSTAIKYLDADKVTNRYVCSNAQPTLWNVFFGGTPRGLALSPRLRTTSAALSRLLAWAGPSET